MRSASSGDRQGKKYQPLRHCRAGAVLVWIPHPIEGVRRIKIYDAILCTELHFKIYSASDSARGGVSLAGSSYLSQNQAVWRVECRTEKTRRAAQPSGGTAFRLQESPIKFSRFIVLSEICNRQLLGFFIRRCNRDR